MTTLLYINASPRGSASASTRAADHFLAALPDSVSVERLPLFERDLPEFASVLASAMQAAVPQLTEIASSIR